MRWVVPLLVALVPVLIWAWLARHHAFLCDDAYISFRYVRNLVSGHGLVFNPGEHVEGYTNFLWILWLAFFWKVLSIGPVSASIGVSVALSLGTLAITWRLATRGEHGPAAWAAGFCALLILSVNRSFAVWTTGGLETRQFTFFVALTVWLLAGYRTSEKRLFWASVALACCVLTRPEGLLVGFCCGVWYVVDAGLRRRATWRGLSMLVVPAGLCVVAHFAFRYGYYGDLLPNTYYAKAVRPWVSSGISYFVAAGIEHGMVVTVPLAVLGAIARGTRETTHLLSAAILVPYGIYVIRLGGDHFEFRMLDITWPLLAVAAADGLLWIARRLAALRPVPPAARQGVEVSAASLVLAVALVYGSVFALGKYQTTRHMVNHAMSMRHHVTLTRQNFPAAFLLPGGGALTRRYNRANADNGAHLVATPQLTHKHFWLGRKAAYGPYATLEGKRILPADATMVHGTIGIVGFHLPMVTIIDRHGLTDRVIARNPAVKPNATRLIAHERKPPPGYLVRRGVNIDIKTARDSLKRATRLGDFVLRVDEHVWMPFDAEEEWVAKAFAGQDVYRDGRPFFE